MIKMRSPMFHAALSMIQSKIHASDALFDYSVKDVMI